MYVLVERFDVLVLGDVNPDLILRGGDLAPVTGQREALAESATLTVGGSGAIFACATARLGLRVVIVGVVGDDIFGGFMHDELEARGVDTRGLIVREGRPTGISVVLSTPEDRGTYTVPGTIDDLSAAAVDGAAREGRSRARGVLLPPERTPARPARASHAVVVDSLGLRKVGRGRRSATCKRHNRPRLSNWGNGLPSSGNST